MRSQKDTQKVKKIEEKRSILEKIASYFALVVWLGAIHLNLLVFFIIVFNLGTKWAIGLLAIWISLSFIPVNTKSKLGTSIAKFICRNALPYFPVELVLEEEGSLSHKETYVFGVEPHSVLPIGLIALTSHAGKLPIRRSVALAASVIFYVPVLRHVWGWMGLAPASRQLFSRSLYQGTSVALVPGGVQECLHMRNGKEVAFLRKRTGFVRLAIQSGAPLVPVFIFGQTGTYRWWMPRFDWFVQLSRRLGFAPLLFWGAWGTPIPRASPMTAVVGKPILVDKIDSPTREQVEKMLALFIASMERIFECHKAAAGYPDLKLEIL